MARMALGAAIIGILWRADFHQIALVLSLLTAPASSNALPLAPVPTPQKLTAVQVTERLRDAPASKGAPRYQSCVPGEKGWDYVCVYVAVTPEAVPMKIGVKVGPTEIVEASMPYPLSDVLPPPTGR